MLAEKLAVIVAVVGFPEVCDEDVKEHVVESRDASSNVTVAPDAAVHPVKTYPLLALAAIV